MRARIKIGSLTGQELTVTKITRDEILVKYGDETKSFQRDEVELIEHDEWVKKPLEELPCTHERTFEKLGGFVNCKDCGIRI